MRTRLVAHLSDTHRGGHANDLEPPLANVKLPADRIAARQHAREPLVDDGDVAPIVEVGVAHVAPPQQRDAGHAEIPRQHHLLHREEPLVRAARVAPDAQADLRRRERQRMHGTHGLDTGKSCTAATASRWSRSRLSGWETVAC